MRTDEKGTPCPETLGEYRDLCEAISRGAGVPYSKAVAFLDERIAAEPEGRDAKVLAPDSQMRAILMPWLIEPEVQH